MIFPEDRSVITDLIDKIGQHSRNTPEKIAVIYHDNLNNRVVSRDYASLYRQICQQAVVLQNQELTDKVIILAYPAGIEFICAFLAVLASGAIAVPAPAGSLLTRKRADYRLKRIIEHSQATAFLAPQAIIDNLQDSLIHKNLWSFSDETWREQAINENESGLLRPYDRNKPAYLQYSSGSTREPNAVVITHYNLACNCIAGNRMMGYDPQTVSLCWMPHFHDYALANGICQPLYCGGEVHLMSPDSFLRRPHRWFELIDRYSVTHSGGPNFAWRYCVDHIKPESVQHLNLSCWRYAHCAAEPIQKAVIQQFVDRFVGIGFSREVLHSCYGLAESVAFVTTGSLNGENAWSQVPGNPHSVVANCGRGDESLTLRIVSPVTKACCAEGEVGEIWFSHASVGKGYWSLAGTSEEIFQAYTASGEGPFLRTGDMGFLHHQDLFVCGRYKDVLIINGQNFYPQDLEAICQAVKPCLRADAGVAFQTQTGEEPPCLVLVQEITGYHSEAEFTRLATQIRQQIREQLALHRIDQIIFVRPGSLDKTSSGKIMRQHTAQRWKTQQLEILWKSPLHNQSVNAPATPLLTGLSAVLSEILGLNAEQLQSDLSLLDLGLDSLTALRLYEALSLQGVINLSLDKLFTLTPGQLLQWSVDGDVLSPRYGADVQQRCFPLSALQSAYLTGRTDALDLGGVGCSYYQEIDCGVVLNPQRLEQAWQTLIQRHDCLRLIFDENGQQRIIEDCPHYPISLMVMAGEWEREALRGEMRTQTRSGRVWPLFDLRMSQVDDKIHFHFWIDLLIIDAQGILTLLTELSELYQTAEHCHLLPISGHCSQIIQLKSELYQARRINGELPWPVLPLRCKTRQVSKPTFTRIQTSLDASTLQKIKRQSRVSGVTFNSVALCALADVLRLWSQAADFMLIVTAQGHSSLRETRCQPALGAWTRSLCLQLDDQNACPFIQRVREIFTRLNERLSQPATDIYYPVESVGDTGVPVVFTSLGEGGRILQEMPGMGRTVDSGSVTPQVAMDFQLWQHDNGLMLTLDYVSELFTVSFANTLLNSWSDLLRLLADGSWLEDCYPKVPGTQLLRRLPADYGKTEEALLYQAPEHHARLTPERLAVLAWDGELTWRVLFEQVGALQILMQHAGLRTGQVVAIDLSKGWKQVVAVLAILRSGGIYLPLERRWPWKRITSILEDAVVYGVISDRERPQSEGRGHWWNYDDPLPAPATIPPAVLVPAHATAYLIYTSGSTGTPKGVAISHYSALNTIMDINRRFNIHREDRILGVSSLAFDLSVYDIFGTLSCGAQLLLPEPESHLTPADLAKFARQKKVTVWNSVPALFQLQVDYACLNETTLPDTLRLVMLSGDWIGWGLTVSARRLNPGLPVISLGGATEASIWSCYYPVGDVLKDWRSVPYGYSLNQQSLHVLDNRLNDCPDEVVGDLYIGGVGLAQGYWNDPLRSATSFIIHPISGQRLYHTGDRARYRGNGLVEFLGRADRQLKVGGYRIEPAEIEVALLAHPGISRCAVLSLARGQNSSPQLVAFLCMPAATRIHQAEREHWAGLVRESLPEYMIPACFIVLPQFPLTANGKIDYRQLTEIAHRQSDASQPVPLKSADSATGWLDDWLQQRLGERVKDEQAGLISLGLTSLDIINLATQAEHQTGMTFSAARLMRIESLAALRRLFAPDAGQATQTVTLHSYERQHRTWLEQQLSQTAQCTDDGQREAFIARQHLLRLTACPTGNTRPLPDTGPFVHGKYFPHCTAADFSAAPCREEQLTACLGALRLAVSEQRLAAPWFSVAGYYPLAFYLWVMPERVEGLEGGIYHYDPVTHQLSTVPQPGRVRETLTGQQLVSGNANALLLMTADFGEILPVYGRESWRNCLLEAGAVGHIIGEVALQCGLGCCQSESTGPLRPAELLSPNEGLFVIHAVMLGMLEGEKISRFRQTLTKIADIIEEGSL
ncbi:amino acid adenylation domain-containing protein [Salmonella enterica subsp. enterica serovar Javiana]|nr:amino acid adenylation domain-containing protein [Salmonella enterica subsp. enterica serovar Javiana]